MNRFRAFVGILITSVFMLISPTNAAPPTPTIVVYASNGRLLINDGMSMQTLALEGTLMKWSVSPDSKWLAVYVSAATREYQKLPLQWSLRLMSLPNGVVRFSAPLLSAQIEQELTQSMYQPNEAMLALDTSGNIAWSPDGTRLAFVSAQDGPTSDVYLLDTRSLQVARLTDGPTQAASLVWSPDGRWIAHLAVDNFGVGAGWSTTQVWLAAADGGPTKKVYDASKENGFVVSATWLDATTLFVIHASSSAGQDKSIVLNIDTGQMTVLDSTLKRLPTTTATRP